MSPILVIEDDRDSREMLCELLRVQGYATVEAANGREGLARLDESRELCLILLDLMMPVMSGWDFRRIQATHAVHAHVPVIVLTADTRMSGRAEELRADALFTKPIEVPDVLEAVRRYCGDPAH